METSKKRIRRDYAPLNVAVSLACITTGSLPTQVYNADNNQYEADREFTPCVIAPIVVAHAKDGSWRNPYANILLAEMKWLVNGKDISTLKDWQGHYSIDTTESSTRGAISIKRNVPPGTVYSLYFEGVVADTRTGTNIPITSEEIQLSTSDKSEDEYSLSIGESQIIRYDPFKDRLFLYEYKVSQGLIFASQSTRNESIDKNAYECRVPITVYKGPKAISSGFNIKLYMVNSSGAHSEISTSSNMEITEISNARISLDLRLITKQDYVIKAFIGNKQIAQDQFSINRMYPKFRCNPTNGTAIGFNDTERYDVAMVDNEGNIVECPESVLRIVWKTDSQYKKGVVHNEGRDTLFLLNKTGIGTTYTDDWLDVYIEAEYKPAHCIASDENGNVFTDESGNILIFN